MNKGNLGWSAYQVFSQNASLPFSISAEIESEDLGERGRDVCVTDRGLIDELRFEIWANRRHELKCIRSAEAAMHALALLKDVVGDLNVAHDGLRWDQREKF